MLLIVSLVLYRQISKNITPDINLGQSNSQNSDTSQSIAQTPAPSPGSTSTQSTPASSGSEQEYQLAPDFTVTDMEGNAVKLSDLRGKPVVVNFWATWCYYCKQEMPDFDKLYGEMGDDVYFMMVNMTNAQESEENARQYVTDEAFSFPVYFDIEQDAALTYGIRSLPTTLFIDADGYLKAAAQQMIDEETLRYGIDIITE